MLIYFALFASDVAVPTSFRGRKGLKMRSFARVLQNLLRAVTQPAPSVAACSAVTRQVHQGSRYANWQALPPLSLAAALCGSLLAVPGACADDNTQPDRQADWSFFSLQTRQLIFFKYEKRIRDMSSLEKVFDYFASVRKEDKKEGKFMTASDLLCSLIPTYPPEGSQVVRAGSLDGMHSEFVQTRWLTLLAEVLLTSLGERSANNLEYIGNVSMEIFKQFDLDNDGLISFSEFMFLLTILSIPASDVQTIFQVVDADGNGEIDYNEFESVITTLEKRVRGTRRRLLPGEQELARPGGMLLSFFGPDRKTKLKLDQFITFVVKLQNELINMEFAFYDIKHSREISCIDFARSLVASCDIKQVDEYMAKVQAMPEELLSQRITFPEFSDLHRIHQNMHKLTVGLDFLAQIDQKCTKAKLSSALKKLTGITLSDKVLNVLFFMFGKPDGTINIPQLLDCLHRRSQLLARRVSHHVATYAVDWA